MKFIFDFDDVLVYTSIGEKNIRGHIYSALEKHGVSPALSREYVERERWNLFSLHKMLSHFSLSQDLYEEIMPGMKNFVNKKLIELVKKLGKENCFIVTYGDPDFQVDKIKRSGVSNLFSEIFPVIGIKNKPIEKICKKYPDEKIFFIDDKVKHFDDLNMSKCPNLKTILYDEQGLEKLKAEIK